MVIHNASEPVTQAAQTSAPLAGVSIVLLALNVPGPVAGARLVELGARVIKIEPPFGDPLQSMSDEWYEQLHRGMDVRRLDLKTNHARAELDVLLSTADLFISSFRPSSLERMQLDRAQLAARFPSLGQVAIVGETGKRAEIAGHDLTYQAIAGLVAPPAMPRTFLADLVGAERTVAAALLLLLQAARGQRGGFVELSLANAVESVAAPLHAGLTTQSGLLGGSYPFYRMYQSADGWIAVAALESQFRTRLCSELAVDSPTATDLSVIFATRTSSWWETWAASRDLPVVAVKELL